MLLVFSVLLWCLKLKQQDRECVTVSSLLVLMCVTILRTIANLQLCFNNIKQQFDLRIVMKSGVDKKQSIKDT